MKFQIDKETLLNPLQQIIGAVEKRQTMPALSNVLIRTTENLLTLTEFLLKELMVWVLLVRKKQLILVFPDLT